MERKGINVRGVTVYGILAAGMYFLIYRRAMLVEEQMITRGHFCLQHFLETRIGSRYAVYALSLPARTVYKMEKVTIFYTPRSRYDMMSLLTVIESMQWLKQGIQTTLEVCSHKIHSHLLAHLSDRARDIIAKRYSGSPTIFFALFEK
jgi:hypothetical protein